jgi:hypothetical protein
MITSSLHSQQARRDSQTARVDASRRLNETFMEEVVMTNALDLIAPLALALAAAQLTVELVAARRARRSDAVLGHMMELVQGRQDRPVTPEEDLDPR